LAPKGEGARKKQNGRFLSKIALPWKKACYKVYFMKTVSEKVVRHSMAYLTVQKVNQPLAQDVKHAKRPIFV